MYMTLIILNFIASMGSVLFACVAITKPSFLSRSSIVNAGEVFYTRMYAARSIPFGLAVGLLPFWYGGVPLALLLFTAALVQAADVLIAVQRKDSSMVTGATVGLVIHAACGLAVL